MNIVSLIAVEVLYCSQGIAIILDDSAEHDEHPVPTFSADAGSSVLYVVWREARVWWMDVGCI